MATLSLKKIEMKYSTSLLAYHKELIEYKDSFNGAAGIETASNIEEWILQLIRDEKIETVREGYVPATTFLLIKDDDYVLGIINIRHYLNDHLMVYGGNIGYNIRPSERRKGYAKEMLRLGLNECRKLLLERVLITCNKDNIGSRKTILANNGVLENEINNNQRITQRFWISLSE